MNLNSATITDLSDIRLHGARHAVYSFLAMALQPPSPGLLARLVDTGGAAALGEAVAAGMPLWSSRAETMHGWLRDAACEAASGSLERRYLAVFGHAAGGSCPPYEISYGPAEIIQQASQLADIRGFYQAFGLEPRANAHERADHAAMECEFMSVLARRLAHALERGDESGAWVLTDAQRAFLADHAGQWLIAFGARLRRSAAGGPYALVGELLQEFIRLDCGHFGVTCGPEFLQPRQADPEKEAAIECGPERDCGEGSSCTPQSDLIEIGLPPARGK